MPDHLISSGEIAKTPIYVKAGERLHADAHCFTEEHTLADVIRYAIACSDYDDVRSILDMMQPEEG